MGSMKTWPWRAAGTVRMAGVALALGLSLAWRGAGGRADRPREDGHAGAGRLLLAPHPEGDGGQVAHALERQRHRAPLRGRRGRRRSRRRAQDAPGHAQRGRADVGRRGRDRQVRLRARRPHDVRLLRGAVLRPREDAPAPGIEPGVEGLRRPELGGRRLGALLRAEARRRPRRPQGPEAVLLGRRRHLYGPLEVRGVQPGAAAFHGARDRAADGAGQRAGLPAAGRGHRAVLQLREEHDRPALAAPPGRDRHQQDGLGQGARRHEARAAAGRARSRARGCRRRSARPATATSRP